MWYNLLAGILICCSAIPLIQNQHWVFRIFDFAKVQILFLQTFFWISAWFWTGGYVLFYIFQALLFICIITNILQLVHYTPFYPLDKKERSPYASKAVSIISANIYQFNTEYERFLAIIRKHHPDMVLTMESNKDWEDALKVLEKQYPYRYYVCLENTYGMHLYSRLRLSDIREHYFVADDIPSIQCTVTTDDGHRFTFFGVHPPPPSPTEEDTSKERDGELLSVAKVIQSLKEPCIVAGDFNNVAWAKSARLFRKTACMIDPRIGRGLISTYHAKYFLLRFPIDQLYHSTDIFVEEIRALDNFGSDHLPLYCRFYIDTANPVQEKETEDLEQGDMEEVNEMIEEGKKEEGDRDAVAEE